jgi:Zn-dependent peptidase ImmA (M78 family)
MVLNKSIDGLKPMVPQPTSLSKSGIFEFAEKLAQALSYVPPASDIKSVVSRLGGKIIVKDFWSTGGPAAESLHVVSANGFMIFLPDHTSVTRDNFTIAHELGHYLLHYVFSGLAKDNREFIAYRYGHPEVDQRTEWEANWFAAAFLMPQKEFSTLFKKLNGSIDGVAEYFLVTTSAAEVRAKDLQLLN